MPHVEITRNQAAKLLTFASVQLDEALSRQLRTIVETDGIQNVQILRMHLEKACVCLGDVRVMASDSMHAVLETTTFQRQRLTDWTIVWTLAS